jgi:uncharacterized protein (TIGR02246 family)
MKPQYTLAFAGGVALGAMALSATPLAYGQSLSQAEATKQVQDIATAFQEGINKHDAAMLANLFTPDAVFVIGAGQTLKGPDQIKDFYVKYFDGPAKSLHDFKPTVGEVRLIGDGAWAIGTSQIISADGKEMDGHWAAVYKPVDGKLRAEMLSAGINAGSPGSVQK